MTTFTDFGLAKPILSALAKEGHKQPTPIQAQAIPYLLQGGDLLGLAQTGSGKTAAFALPILHKLFENPAARPKSGWGPRALVLAPTRELAAQVKERFDAYGARTGLRTGLVIGGAPISKQKNMIRRGIDVLIATPGRLEDHMRGKSVRLDQVDMLVLDEVDQMLDLGFIHSIRAICAACPAERQSLFFSATMPREIRRLADALLRDPLRIDVEPAERPKIEQSVRFMTKGQKPGALVELSKTEGFKSAIVFSRTKHGADKIVRVLNAAGESAQAIHGNRNQAQRTRALSAFKRGEMRILVATDIAARGIDISNVSHVVNYDLPNVPQTYVHRIGRTGRAGKTGKAISFCSADERPFLRDIERLIGERIAATGNDSASREGSQEKRRERPAHARDHANKSRRNEERKPRNRKHDQRGDRRVGEQDAGTADAETTTHSRWKAQHKRANAKSNINGKPRREKQPAPERSAAEKEADQLIAGLGLANSAEKKPYKKKFASKKPRGNRGAPHAGKKKTGEPRKGKVEGSRLRRRHKAA